jgi:hypothetical protein
MYESAMLGIASARVIRIGVKEALGIPPAIGRKLGYRIGTASDQPPEILWGAHSAWITAAHADDCDRLAPVC